MVGTPAMMVSRSRRSISSIDAGSNRASNDIEPPTVKVAIMTDAWPNTWNSGSPVPVRSALEARLLSAPISPADSRFPTVSWAPFGRPVVPEVYRMAAVSSRSRSTTPAGAAVTDAPGDNVQEGTESVAAASATAGPRACHAIANEHPASPRTYSTSARVDIVLTGTTTQPAA